jgi:hypothetical protein
VLDITGHFYLRGLEHELIDATALARVHAEPGEEPGARLQAERTTAVSSRNQRTGGPPVCHQP